MLTAPAGARQFLEAYKSVTLESMAQAFGVSPAFMDAELAEFIVAGRVSAKIDKARGPRAGALHACCAGACKD